MSRICNDLAWDAEIKPSTLKFTLLSLCDYADNAGFKCYPSIETIARHTSQNRKTVQSNIRKLIEMGIVNDTGKTVGKTQKVRVFQINIEALKRHDPKNGMIPKTGLLNDPKNGIQNQSLLNQSDNAANSKESAIIKEAKEKAFNLFWSEWTEIKKSIGKKNHSRKPDTIKRWNELFNKPYFEKNTIDDLEDELNEIVIFAKQAHAENDGKFNKFHSTDAPKFLSSQYWRFNND